MLFTIFIYIFKCYAIILYIFIYFNFYVILYVSFMGLNKFSSFTFLIIQSSFNYVSKKKCFSWPYYTDILCTEFKYILD